jgi:hypothetical protein
MVFEGSRSQSRLAPASGRQLRRRKKARGTFDQIRAWSVLTQRSAAVRPAKSPTLNRRVTVVIRRVNAGFLFSAGRSVRAPTDSGRLYEPLDLAPERSDDLQLILASLSDCGAGCPQTTWFVARHDASGPKIFECVAFLEDLVWQQDSRANAQDRFHDQERVLVGVEQFTTLKQPDHIGPRHLPGDLGAVPHIIGEAAAEEAVLVGVEADPLARDARQGQEYGEKRRTCEASGGKRRTCKASGGRK